MYDEFLNGGFVTISPSLESIILFVNPIIINVQIIFKLTKNSKRHLTYNT